MLDEVVNKYLQIYPEDKKQLKILLEQLKDKDKLDDRRNFRGHIAGDAVVLSPNLKKVLCIFHPVYGTWQQPGGHLEPDEEGPWVTAAREAYEETGVIVGEKIGPIKADGHIPLHIITGPVPANSTKNEAMHWHHDFRYGFIAKTEQLDRVDDRAIKKVKWIDLGEVRKMKNAGHNFQKSIDRLLSLLDSLKP